MRNFAAQRPGLFSLLAILLPVVGLKLVQLLLTNGLPELTARLIGEMLFSIYGILLVTGLGWWREIGIFGRLTGRGLASYAPWLLLPLLVVLGGGGLHPADAGRVLSFAAFTLMVGFAEEVLVRGIVLRALLPRGVMKAALLSSILFGLAHLMNLLTGSDFQSTIVQVLYATLIGMGLAGPRLFSGSVLPAILLHALIDFSDQVARGFVLTPPKPVTLQGAAFVIVLTALYALYGWWLIRRSGLEGGWRGFLDLT